MRGVAATKGVTAAMVEGGGMDEREAVAALARVTRGDETALEELYRAFAPAVLAFVLGRVESREVAEEVAGDTWLGCWRSAAAFRGDSRVLTWLLGIAKRQAYVRTRRARLAECTLDDSLEMLVDDARNPSDLALEAAGMEELLAALDALPPELAETVRLAWLHELPYAEIAAVMDVPTGTVKSRVSRARRLLQDRLGRQS